MEHFYQKIQGWFSFPELYKSMVKKYDNAVFVEVGTWKGKSAAFMAVEIANSKKNIKFYCVDVWQNTGDPNLLINKDPLSINGTIYNHFLENISPVINYINPVKKTSVEAALNFKNNSLDFVFIDASHTYEDVTKDLQVWFPKIKKEGTLAGHDFDWPSVKNAVHDFFKDKNLKVKEQEQSWLVNLN